MDLDLAVKVLPAPIVVALFGSGSYSKKFGSVKRDSEAE